MSPAERPVRLLGTSQDDLVEIVSYIAADDPTAADSFVDKMETRLESLGEFPEKGRVPREKSLRDMGYRYVVFKNYLIFYTLEKRTVLVHRILHGARDYLGLL